MELAIMGKENFYTATLLFLSFVLLIQTGEAQDALSGALSRQTKRFSEKSEAAKTELPQNGLSNVKLEGPFNPPETQQDKELEPHYWNLNIALMRQKKGLDNFSEVLTAYTDLVERACMSSLQSTLEHNGQDKSKACQEALNQFGAIAPEAPSLVCARDGIDSPTCSEAHRALEIETAMPSSATQTSESDKLFGESSADTEERLRQKAKKLLDFEDPEGLHTLPEKEREEKLTSVHKILVRLLEIGCKGTVYGVAKKKPKPKEKEKFDFLRREKIEASVQSQPAKTSYADRGTKPRPKMPSSTAGSAYAPLEDQPSEFFTQDNENSASKVARQVEEDETLVRYITPQCQSQIGLAFRWDSNFYAAICAQYGEYSPNCIQAKRAYRKIIQSKAPKQKPRIGRSYNPQRTSREPEKLFQTF